MNKSLFYTAKHYVILLILTTPAWGVNPPVFHDAKQLIQKFSEERNKQMNSFIIEGRMDRDYKYKYMTLNRKGVDHKNFAFKYDGNRSKESLFIWGNVSRRSNNVTENNAHYTSSLWDGDSVYGYNRIEPSRSPGNVRITRKNHLKGKRKVYSEGYKYTWAGQIMGFHKYDGERVDDLLINRSRYLRLRENPEKVGGVDCYVIDASVKRNGKYTLWIDPIHDFHIAKIETQRGENDYIGGGRLLKGDYASETFEVLRFERVGNTWFPKECRCKSFRKLKKTGNYQDIDTVIKFTNVHFNPDHEALQSFIPNDIANGAGVEFAGLPPGVEFIWQDGELIPNIDKNVKRQIDAEIEKILSEYKSLDESSGQSISELLAKYRATQEQLRSFITKGESTIAVIIDKNSNITQKQKTVSEFRRDGDRVAHRVYLEPGLNSYKSFLWDGKVFIEYRQPRDSATGKVNIYKFDIHKKNAIATEYKGAGLLGICRGDWEPVDLILDKADTIALREKSETIGDSKCQVIEAVGKHGKYTVWIDPKHGYNIAKIEVHKSKGDLYNLNMPVKTQMTYSLENVRFKKFSNIWVPMEADMEHRWDDRNEYVRWHHKRTKFLLNPDHDALDSFMPDDIPDGTKVKLTGEPGEYTWQNGKVAGIKN